jgi:hypothetical protein
MARQENPPFGRGETYYGVNPPSTGQPSLNDALQEEGAEWYFNDIVWTNPPGVVGARAARTNRLNRCRVVRNVSGTTLLPKRLVNLQLNGTDGRYYEGRVDGYSAAPAQRAYPLDEFLGATTGLPNLDLGWITIEGPAMVQTDLAAIASINVGDIVVANNAGGATASGTTSTTGGRVTNQSLTGATAPLANQIMNFVGRALSALTTSQTGTDLLIDVGKY